MNARALVLMAVAICTCVSAVAGPDSLRNAVNRTVEVRLPDSTRTFPPGEGAEVANSQCMICHSAGMVTRQPPLSLSEWRGEVNKMHSVYGAPLPADEVEMVAQYLTTTINGKP